MFKFVLLVITTFVCFALQMDKMTYVYEQNTLCTYVCYKNSKQEV